MKSRPKICSNNESNFTQLFCQQFKRFGDECQLLSRFKLGVQNVHHLQQHTIKVSFQTTALPYQWNRVANHFISTTKQSSARQCWSVLVCISDSVPLSLPHMIINGWDMCIRLKYQQGYFLCKNHSLITCWLNLTLKNACVSSNSYNFWM